MAFQFQDRYDARIEQHMRNVYTRVIHEGVERKRKPSRGILRFKGSSTILATQESSRDG
jgi:hypothetical protein